MVLSPNRYARRGWGEQPTAVTDGERRPLLLEQADPRQDVRRAAGDMRFRLGSRLA
ncbi:hypothetical protein [Streptomyces sp. NPDC086989]|uniref:hypothetical protein n=1 Tax=Streptomyces sp. NPDC086989 TaxID=3365764 RepID=UPI00380315BB